jgi:hypothetical protein
MTPAGCSGVSRDDVRFHADDAAAAQVRTAAGRRRRLVYALALVAWAVSAFTLLLTAWVNDHAHAPYFAPHVRQIPRLVGLAGALLAALACAATHAALLTKRDALALGMRRVTFARRVPFLPTSPDDDAPLYMRLR